MSELPEMIARLDRAHAVSDQVDTSQTVDLHAARGKIVNWLIAFGMGGRSASDCADRIITILDRTDRELTKPLDNKTSPCRGVSVENDVLENEHVATDDDYLWFLFNEQGVLASGPCRIRPVIEPGYTATGVFINRIATAAKPVE